MNISDFDPLDLNCCHLNEAHIDLWFLPLNQDLSALHSILSLDEKKRASRFYFEKHQRRFIHARGLLRSILSRYLAQKPEQIEFQYNKQGKPELPGAAQIQFNISHTGEWALIAVGQNHPLGVDVERFSARPYSGIAEHVFSSEEQQELNVICRSIKPWLFFNIWSQKEAFIKACGLGLSYPTKNFTVTPIGLNSQPLLNVNDQSRWLIKTFMPKLALCAALCHHPDVTTIRYLELTQPNLLF